MRLALVLLAAAFAARAESGSIPISCKTPAASAQVERGLAAIDGVRVAEAQSAFERALSFDGSCATAHAMLATILPATQAGAHIDAAIAGSAKLPAAERTRIEAAVAGFHGDNAKVRELTQRLVDEAPGDWRAHNGLGLLHLTDQDYPKAVAAFTRAIELNPKAGGAYNNLGYAYSGQERFEEAVATFEKYAQVAPADPNAHDSLAEALMNTGRFAESEAEFRKALKLNPKFAGAWTGIAQTRLFRGDERGADEALRKELSVDTRPQARMGNLISGAYALLAEGKPQESFKACDSIRAEAKKLNLPTAYFIDALQARLQLREGHVDEGLRLANGAYERTAKAQLPSGLKRGVLQGVLIEVVRANALLGKREATEKALAEMEQVVAPAAQNAFNASQLQNARGWAAIARGDVAAGIGEMQKCIAADFQCQYELVQAQERAGDHEGAEATRAKFLKVPRRGIEYVYLWKKLGGKPVSG